MARLLALALTGLILIPGGAHLFTLPASMRLGRDAYFHAQPLYAGWASFALPILGAILANLLLGYRSRKAGHGGAAAGFTSAGLILLSLLIFVLFVLPGNRATENWTRLTPDWERLRLLWEYGHAASAILVVAALLFTGRAIMGDPRA